MDLVTAGEVTGLVIGIGGASAVVVKGAQALRRLGHFIDKLAGNGTSEPGILKRLEDLKTTVDDLAHGQVNLQQSADSRDEQIDGLTTAVTTMGAKIDHHVDGDAKTWMEEGQQWGNRLEAHLTDHDTRIAALEGNIEDPAVGTHHRP